MTDKPSFGEVIYSSIMTPEPVEFGFGEMKLLKSRKKIFLKISL